MPKPTLIFIHGAWHSSRSWTSLRSALESKGFETHAVDLVSVGIQDNPPKDHQEDVVAIQVVLNKLVKEGKKVVLIAHAYGAVPASGSVEGFESEVVGVVFVDALLVPVGSSVSDVMGADGSGIGEGNVEVVSSFYTSIPSQSAHSIFYNDVSLSLAQPWISDLRPQTIAVSLSKVTYVAWAHVPCMYIDCTESVTVLRPAKERMFEHVRRDARWPLVVRRLEGSSHTPMMRFEGELGGWIGEVAGWEKGGRE